MIFWREWRNYPSKFSIFYKVEEFEKKIWRYDKVRYDNNARVTLGEEMIKEKILQGCKRVDILREGHANLK